MEYDNMSSLGGRNIKKAIKGFYSKKERDSMFTDKDNPPEIKVSGKPIFDKNGKLVDIT